MRTIAVIVAALLAATLAGCTTDPQDQSETIWSGGTLHDPGRNAPGTHVHDLWGPETEMTIMNASVPVTILHNHFFDEPPREMHLHNCDEVLLTTSQGGSIVFTLPVGEVVPPNTARIDFTFAWSSPSITGLRFQYQPPDHGHLDHGDHGHSHAGFTDAGYVSNGRTVSIPVYAGMSDLAHSVRSQWAFLLCADTQAPHLADGMVRVEAVAHRAEELSLDPPHPDHWGGAAALPLAHYEWQGETWSALNQNEHAWHHLVFQPGAIVAPGTQHITVTAWLNATAAAGLPATPELLLYVKDPTEVDWVYRAVKGAQQGGRWAFEIVLDDIAQWDSHYATRSHWDLWLRVLSSTAAQAPSDMGLHGAPFRADITLHAEVVAYA